MNQRESSSSRFTTLRDLLNDPQPESVRPSSEIHDIAHRLKMAADPTRLQVLILLAGDDRCVSDLSGEIPGAKDNHLAHHLTAMRLVGLIESHKSGSFRIYSLTEAGRQLVQIVTKLSEG